MTPPLIELALDRGALGTAAVLVGLGQAMLDMTVGYVKERQQFGQPIGSFQAVKHHLADAALALAFARPAVWRAAWSVAHLEPTRARDVSMAKAMASDAAELVGRKALQCHGAIGYTVEADLHLYLKRTWALARTWGDAAHHTDRVAQALESGPMTRHPRTQPVLRSVCALAARSASEPQVADLDRRHGRLTSCLKRSSSMPFARPSVAGAAASARSTRPTSAPTRCAR